MDDLHDLHVLTNVLTRVCQVGVAIYCAYCARYPHTAGMGPNWSTVGRDLPYACTH